MKTLKDLEDMKTQKSSLWGTQYDLFFARLEDYYISKLDGIDRIQAELSNWDKDAQEIIINELIRIISNSGIIGFNKNKLLSLLR